MKNHEGSHKYVKRLVGINKSVFYFCALPDCRHHLTTPEMLEFRTSICWRCDKEFQITRANTLLRKPYTTKPSCCKKEDIRIQNTQIPSAAANLTLEDLKRIVG